MKLLEKQTVRSSRSTSPALQPWVNYLSKLHPAEAQIMLHDMMKYGIMGIQGLR